ncbi:Preprotein translocase subunit SecG (TC 3.A.5.1.1) [plant metagenome]|uniref:Protein-export membrane protein SecG n=2 Tax=root TaxID=1 RepID=A0A1C3K7U9_9BURK|nr:preprotein translocase subunit SecG [Orrella dioscoreae]SBT27524.1 Preprotein translocase subunit SecG (TC 3.A.5.1.1) [Orrella dioscoreae]SOE48135.1 Preprotein translocase subunit SecG (TC 3.A.5.1.1) [Orrella dioscoreae]
MSMMLSVLLAVQVISSLTIIVLVLLQQGKGADMGSSFGSGSAGSLFGASGAANFLSRSTKWAAVVFFATTAGLAYLGHNTGSRTGTGGGVMQDYQDRSVPTLPGQTAPASPEGASSVPQAPAAPQAPAPGVPAAPQQQPAPAAEVPAAPAQPAQ